MTDKPMMKCGHSANSVAIINQGVRIPSCAICAGMNPDALVIDEAPPNLEGREAVCAYDGTRVPSSPNCAFFQYRPDKGTDTFYCGCRGWD
jgi:hypothetical protein